MQMNSFYLTIFMVVFILLGVYNVFSGLRRVREAQTRGQHIAWFRQINLLTGIEYLLLSFVFMLSLNLHNNAFPAFLKPIVVPFYLLILLLSAVIAGFVIRQAILNARLIRKNPTAKVKSNNVITPKAGYSADEVADEDMTAEQRASVMQHQRERRQKAAAARRRRAGRA
ncbi:MAG: hypothetical protein ACR2H5_14265 [Ktedonobacteraceae bacterium]